MDQIKLFEETFGISLITTNQIHMSLFGRQLFLAWLVLVVWPKKMRCHFWSPVMGPKNCHFWSPVMGPRPNWGDSCWLPHRWAGELLRPSPPPGAPPRARGGGLGEEEEEAAGGAGGGAGGGGGGGAGEGGGSCTWLQHSAASSTGPHIYQHNQRGG